MAPRSSIMASAVKNIFRERGMRFPARESIPSAKAISVAIGMPKPICVGVSELKIKWIKAGKIIPPAAAITGSKAFLILDNSPM